MTETSNTTIG